MGHKHSPTNHANKTPKTLEDPEHRQHNFNFNIQLSTDEKGEVHQLRIAHIQSVDTASPDKEGWHSWEPQKLIDFIARVSGVSSVAARIIAETALAREDTDQFPGRPVALAGTVSLSNLETLFADGSGPVYILQHGQSYLFHLVIDYSNVLVQEHINVNSKITILAKQPGKMPLVAAETTKPINFSESRAGVTIAGSTLAPGVYILEAQASLTTDPKQSQPPIAVSLKGDLLEVV